MQNGGPARQASGAALGRAAGAAFRSHLRGHRSSVSRSLACGTGAWSFVRDVLLQLLHPDPRVSVGRCPPVTPWREVAAGDHLRAIRHRGALELADLKEAIEKNAKPF